MTIPWWDVTKKAYRSYEAALKLVDSLVDKDTNWIEPVSADADWVHYAVDKDAEEGSTLASNHNDEVADRVRAPVSATQINPATAKAKEPIKSPTPLAYRIIEKHPQRVEQVGPCMVHFYTLAIKCRRIKIFDIVVNMPMHMRRLVKLKDEEGNSILHMVALTTGTVKDEKNAFCICTDATSTNKVKGKPLRILKNFFTKHAVLILNCEMTCSFLRFVCTLDVYNIIFCRQRR